MKKAIVIILILVTLFIAIAYAGFEVIGDLDVTEDIDVGGDVNVIGDVNALGDVRAGESLRALIWASGDGATFGGKSEWGTAIGLDRLEISARSATNTDIRLLLRPKGTGEAFIEAAGTLNIVDVDFIFMEGKASILDGASEGTTEGLELFGFRTGDQLRSMTVGVGEDEDNSVSFTGLSKYIFDNVVAVDGLGTGGRTDYDLKVGDTTTPDYGMIQFGNAVIGRTSYKAGQIDLDGAILFQNIGGPVTGPVEFCFAVSTGASTRLALAKPGVGNASYHSRSFLMAGPAPADTNYVLVRYWQINNSIFDKLACDTAGDGADLGVQNDIQLHGDLFVDSIKESTDGAGVTFGSDFKISKITPTLILDNTGDGDGNEPRLLYQQGGSGRALTFWDGDVNEFVVRSEGPSSDGALAFQTGGANDRLVISKAGVSAFSGQVDVTGAITATGDILSRGSVASSDPVFANYLRFAVTASSISSDRILTFNVNDAARLIDLSGNFTVEATSIINSDLSTDADWETSGSIKGGSLLTGGNIGITGDVDTLVLTSGQLQINGNVDLTNTTTVFDYGDAGAVDNLEFKGNGANANIITFSNAAASNSFIMVLSPTIMAFNVANQFNFTSTNESIALTASTAGKSITLTSPTINLGASTATNITAGPLSIKSQNELRFYDNGNHVGFEAPALSADQIWKLPTADGLSGEVLTTNGSGALFFTANASEKTWAFMSRDASSGTNYIGGFYKFGASDNDFNPSITFGTANVSYAAHFFLVQAAGASGGTDTVIRVTGTTIDDQGNRTAAVDVDITVDDAGAANTYYETTEKWLGQVTIAKQSGPDLLCNYGFAKYWDNNNTAFKVVGIEATWLGAKNDATPDIELRHHKTTGWTYNNGAAPTPPSVIASMAKDHNTEIQIATAQEGAWKRDNLSTNIDGGSGEGTIIELTTTTNRTYAIGNFLIRITPQ